MKTVVTAAFALVGVFFADVGALTGKVWTMVLGVVLTSIAAVIQIRGRRT